MLSLICAHFDFYFYSCKMACAFLPFSEGNIPIKLKDQVERKQQFIPSKHLINNPKITLFL